MAVISVPGQEPQKFRNQTLRELCERARPWVYDEGERYLLEEAAALGALYFEPMEPSQRTSLARALIIAARDYRDDLLRQPDLDESDRSREEALAELPPYLGKLLPEP
ncbi:hypothetical protein [Streptoalloteichus hindustanus]|uniref:Uncharacterized protein n=1 Tax=Streptoalloteichus hindustanus TaxID=2017 RepID=A0A1M4YXK7_STRHI|nr:hypothetical protein [Streptoalloteichus hindustanus]SHF10523.1 hypothetical protein SAMN05444320_102526 [Streptoalloteichus hindustanus]